MLKFLRKKGVMKRILWVVAVVIIISFGFFGTANYLQSRTGKSYAGRIFEKRISREAFRESLLHAKNQAVMRYGENFFKISQFLDLEREAWDRLILLHEARKRNIRIPDEDVIEQIRALDFFQIDGRFDPQLYERLVRHVFHSTPRQFEEGIRDALAFAAVFEQETQDVAISDEEIREAYRESNQQVKVEYVVFSAEDYLDTVTVDADALKAYYTGHPEDFRLPQRVKAEYIHIAFSEDLTEEDKDALVTQAGKVTLELEKDPDMNRAAGLNGLTVEETGYFSRQQPSLSLGWSPDLLESVFSLKEDEISPPVATEKGLYIIKIVDKKESEIPEFDEARPKVEERLRHEKAAGLAREESGKALNNIRSALESNPGQGFAQACNSLGLGIRETPLFRRGEYIPGIGLARAFQEAAFGLSGESPLSGVVETPIGHAILYLQSSEGVGEETYQKEKEEFARRLILEKKNKIFNDFLARLRAKANLESNIPRAEKEAAGD